MGDNEEKTDFLTKLKNFFKVFAYHYNSLPNQGSSCGGQGIINEYEFKQRQLEKDALKKEKDKDTK